MNYTEETVSEAMEGLPALWVLKHRIKNESGLLLDFSKRKFLWDIYNDLSPKQAFLKPPQIGATVMSMLKSMWVAKKLRKDIIYTLPTATDVNDIVGGSVNRIIVQNPILRSWVKDHDTVEQKSVGENLIRYRGTFSPKQATMVPSSLNIHDEVDNSDPTVLTLYQTRLEAQEREEDKWRWYFSHPSLAGHGVDIYWQLSDKKEWYVRCQECLKSQVLTWPENISIERNAYICSKCQATLTDEARINGQWKNQDGIPWQGKVEGNYEFSGWHVSQLMLYNKSAADIIAAKNDPQKDEQYFYNYVLGLPYTGGSDKLEPSEVLANCVDEVNPLTERIIIGVDTGLPIYFTMLNKDGVFYYNSCKDYTTLEGLLRKYPNSILVSDQGGDLIGIRQLQEKYPGRVFLCYYRKDRKSFDMIQWGEKSEYGKVVVDRNRFMSLIVEQIKDTGRLRINGKKEDWKEWAAMFGNIYREVVVDNERPGKDSASLYGNEYVWKRSGPDHYCFVRGTKITTNKGQKNIEDIKIGDRVFTRNGYKSVYDTGLQRKRQDVYTAYFSNGSYFTATGDHPVIHTEGKERLDTLSRHAILYSCQEQKYASITGSYTDGTQTLLGGQIEFISHQVEPTSQKDTRDFISRYGWMPLELFLKGLSYIIKTKIRLITNYLTWCAKVEEGIKVSMFPIDMRKLIIESETNSILRESEANLMSGVVLKQEKRGIRIMLIKASFSLFLRYLRVLSAVLKGLHAAIRAVSSVAPDVVIVGLHGNIAKKDVINLSVEDEHEYFANNILVSNCHTLLYGLVGLDKYGTGGVSFAGESAFEGIPVAGMEYGQEEGWRANILYEPND